MDESKQNGENVSDAEKVDVLQTHYEQMREEIRIIGQIQDRQILRGIAAIAVVVGSIFVTREAIILLTIVPFILWILFVRQMQSMNWVVRIEGHIIDIQKELDVDHFDWEQKYGFHSKTVPWGLSIPNIALGVFLVSAYGFTALVSIEIVRNKEVVDTLGIHSLPVVLGGVYMIAALFGFVVLLSFIRILRKEQRDIEQ